MLRLGFEPFVSQGRTSRLWLGCRGRKERRVTRVAARTIGDIEQILLRAFPLSLAVPDDRLGLFVGDRTEMVSHVAIALDATVPMIKAAAAQDCNLLVTHHPPFWDAPKRFTSSASAGSVDGAVVYAAARAGVALMTMHTNVDCAPNAYKLLLNMMELRYVGALRPQALAQGGALGQLAHPQINGTITLQTLAATCERNFGQLAKVWGSPQKLLWQVAVCSGAGSEVVDDVLSIRPDCFVTGELRHHENVCLADEGIAVIELGHDASELPYRQLLQMTLEHNGVFPLDIVVLEPSASWWTMDTLRAVPANVTSQRKSQWREDIPVVVANAEQRPPAEAGAIVAPSAPADLAAVRQAVFASNASVVSPSTTSAPTVSPTAPTVSPTSPSVSASAESDIIDKERP